MKYVLQLKDNLKVWTNTPRPTFLYKLRLVIWSACD